MCPCREGSRRGRRSEHHAFFLHSADGLTWDAVPSDEGQFAGVEIRSLVVGAGDRLYAIGSASTDDRGGSRIAVWVSDDGRSWHEAVGPFGDAFASSLAAGPSGLLMLGGGNHGSIPKAWRSNDGETWDATPLELPVPAAAAQLTGAASVGDDWLAAGTISTGADAPAAAVVWRSLDGISWSCTVLDPAGFSRVRTLEVHRSGDRWLIIGIASQACGFGASCVGYPIAWSSPDGVAWSGAILDENPIGLGITAYAGSAEGFLGVRSATWFSVDGRDWVRVLDGETSGAIGGQADAVVITDGGNVIAVGAA